MTKQVNWPMTKREKEILLKAVENLARGEGEYSCCAISRVTNKSYEGEALMQKYTAFYEQTIGFWPELEQCIDNEEILGWRLTLLLLFREVGLEGIV